MRESDSRFRAIKARVKWYHLYFILAAFDVVTVLVGLTLSHNTNQIFSESVHKNTLWLEQLGDYSALGELAAKVNAPGNDIFDSHDVPKEEERLEIALGKFNQQSGGYLGTLEWLHSSGEIEFEDFNVLRGDFERINDSLAKMISEARSIFNFFSAGEVEKAGQRMATMDRRYAELNHALAGLRTSAVSILAKYLRQQQDRVKELRQIEYAVMVLTLIMIIGVSVYGHRLSKAMRRAELLREEDLRNIELSKSRSENNEQRLLSLAHNVPVGIFETDQNGRCIFVNERWTEIAGISLEQATNNGWTDSLHPDDREMVIKEWYAAAHSNRPFTSQYRFLRGDGVTTWVLGIATPVPGADGKLLGYVGSLTDITKQKELEETLELARVSAEEATRNKSQFLANMSHEIRTPMNGVLGMTELLLESGLNEDQKELASCVKESASSLLCIINDILDFSKIEAGKMAPSPYFFNLQQLIQQIVHLHSMMSNQKEIELILEYQDDVPTIVYADADRLRQILNNLIGNAIKFTSQRGVVLLSIAATESESPDNKIVTFKVTDTGIGIPQDKQGHIFEAFGQADGSTTRRFGGTGLGLTISSRLVSLMGGTLSLSSRFGIGSSFYFSLDLPMGTEEMLEKQTPLISSSHLSDQQETGPALSILLVEDNVVNQQLAQRILKKAGHSVTVASNGHEALERYDHYDFDIVFMDIQMPILGGEAATQIIREREKNGIRRVPIIALTANAMAGDREHYLGLGMDDYLSKPLSIKQLNKMIERHRPASKQAPSKA